MKKIILGLVAFLPVIANAVPNHWTSNFAQGYIDYVLINSKNQRLIVTCDAGATDLGNNHSVSYEPNWKKPNYYSSTDSDLSFLFDGKISAEVPQVLGTRIGDNNWYEFKEGIAKSKKIDIYISNKKVATFTPSVASINQIGKKIADCGANN
mgnify:FL=1